MLANDRATGVFWRIAGATCVVAAVVSSCARREVRIALPPVPSTLKLQQEVSSTKGRDYSSAALDVVESSIPPTSTIGFESGRASLSGLVEGPDGPVEGAIVRIERFVGESLAVKDVLTDASGRYRIENVRSGRVRMRAWRAPDLATFEPAVAFAGGDFEQSFTLKRYDEVAIQWSLAPSTPRVNEAANIVIQVTRQSIGDDGILRPQFVPNLGVTVTPLGYLQGDSVREVLTNERGRAQVQLRCNGVGSSELQVSLATGESNRFSPPSCQPLPTLPPPTEATTTVAPVPVAVPATEAGPSPLPQPVPIATPPAASPPVGTEVPPTAAPIAPPVPVPTASPGTVAVPPVPVAAPVSP